MTVWLQPEPQNWWHIVDDAVMEDIGSGDITGGIVPPEHISRWQIVSAIDCVLSGVGIAEHLLAPYGPDPDEADVQLYRGDGDFAARGEVILSGVLPTRRTLMAQRTVLNFLGHLSGIATMTAEFVHRVNGTNAVIIDTRATVPILRGLQRYAVRCGGGGNHRMGLFDGAVIEQKHIDVAGSITDAMRSLRSYISHMTKIQVTCNSVEAVAEAVIGGADAILLDNMDPFMMREALKSHKGRCLFEASGNYDLDTVRAVAQTGVDLISIPAITLAPPAIEFRLEFL